MDQKTRHSEPSAALRFETGLCPDCGSGADGEAQVGGVPGVTVGAGACLSLQPRRSSARSGEGLKFSRGETQPKPYCLSLRVQLALV